MQGDRAVSASGVPAPGTVMAGAVGQRSSDLAATSSDVDLGEHIIPVLASVLTSLIERNDSIPFNQNQLTIFHALRPPEITVRSYLDRMYKYAACSNECYVLALIYIDRVIQQNRFVITSLNVHRLLITSVMLAAKFIDDTYYNNAYYARVGGVPCGEMNSLELEFLFLINFGLHTTPEIFYRYRAELWRHTQQAVAGPPAANGYLLSGARPAGITPAAGSDGQQGPAQAIESKSAASSHISNPGVNPIARPSPARPAVGTGPIIHRGFHPTVTSSPSAGDTGGAVHAGGAGDTGVSTTASASMVSRRADSTGSGREDDPDTVVRAGTRTSDGDTAMQPRKIPV